MHPLERLLNLLALLLNASRPLTFAQIRRDLPAYGQGDDESAKRMFERDKDTLRGMGIPVEVAPTDVWEAEQGYVIDRERYELPELSFTPEEVAALFVAAAAPGDEGEAALAFRKLALGADAGVLSDLVERGPTVGVERSSPHLEAAADAATRHRRIRFRYRGASGDPSDRVVDAWALRFKWGSWYLVGLDRDRGEPRAFRLSRLLTDAEDAGEGDPPPDGFDSGPYLQAGPWGVGEPRTTARVAFGPKVAWWAVPSVPGARVLRTRRDGWIEAEVPAAGGEALASWVLSFGPDAEAVAPPELREAVVGALEEVRASL
jgi:proteasome accessory factor B